MLSVGVFGCPEPNRTTEWTGPATASIADDFTRAAQRTAAPWDSEKGGSDELLLVGVGLAAGGRRLLRLPRPLPDPVPGKLLPLVLRQVPLDPSPPPAPFPSWEDLISFFISTRRAPTSHAEVAGTRLGMDLGLSVCFFFFFFSLLDSIRGMSSVGSSCREFFRLAKLLRFATRVPELACEFVISPPHHRVRSGIN